MFIESNVPIFYWLTTISHTLEGKVHLDNVYNIIMDAIDF